jgi:isoleucyl-tRNA synthetase
MTRTVKDSVLRYRYMTGHRISRRTGGWDCHGLPVEIEAEKHFGFKVKKEIEEFGIDKFNEYCRESIFRYIDEWMETDEHLGYWVDQENAYVTMRNDYIESENHVRKEDAGKGLQDSALLSQMRNITELT